MKYKRMSRFSNTRVPSTFKIQITSMVDVFVILLVFLIKSFSTSPVQINPSMDLKLPESSSMTEPEDVIKLVVSKKGIFVEDNRVLELKEGFLTAKDVDLNDPNFIKSLYEELDKQAAKTKKISEVNTDLKFDGRILVQADRDLSYDTLRKVLYTSMLVGYADVKLAVVSR
jgi:biopolymer transport protein ExbD